MRKLAPPAPRPRHRASPRASATPIGVAITIVAIARIKLCRIAATSVGSFRTDRSGSSIHHRSENPCQTLRDRPALNENPIAITTGTIAHAR